MMTRLSAALGVLSAVVAACNSPSEKVDEKDLHGVFDDAGAKGASSAAPVRSGRASASASASVAPPVAHEPSDPACVRQNGEPSEVRHVIGRPACRGAEVLEWRDPSGAPRYACVFTPAETAKKSPLPVLVYFHGSSPGLDDPASFSKLTSLRSKMESFDLTGDPAHRGFVVLGVQGRAIGKARASEGASFDTAHVAPDNLDKVTTDHFLDVLSERGLVDDKRVYAFGMGKGAEMAATYAMLRADRVAAFFAYAPSPPPASWQCPGPPPPAFVAYRACDTVTTCDAVETWLRSREGASAETRALRLGDDNREEPNCTPKNKCGKKKGEAHHYRWPKGREKDLLQFFASHRMK